MDINRAALLIITHQAYHSLPMSNNDLNIIGLLNDLNRSLLSTAILLDEMHLVLNNEVSGYEFFWMANEQMKTSIEAFLELKLTFLYIINSKYKSEPNRDILTSFNSSLQRLEEENQSSKYAWYVIHTLSRHEAVVERALHRKTIETFLPRITIPSRRQDRKLFIKVPLFPGYIFVNTLLDLPLYHKIIKLKGVLKILGSKNHFEVVPTETVESIRIVVSSGRPFHPCPILTKGRRVRIMEGPLAGATGIITYRSKKERNLVVSVDIFQQAVTVALEDEAVAPYL
jgi:transcription termination/antitermination protein NusG